MIHFRRYLAALLVLTSSWAAYALAVAPWIEPPPVKRREVQPRSEPLKPTPQTQADLLALFPEGDWVRDETKVKVIETEQATLLIQEYLPTEEGQLELRPCTIIFYATGNQAADAKQSPDGKKGRRPIVLRANGALLEFDNPLDLSKSQFGELEKGTLAGPITIYSPPTTPDSRDELHLTTRHVRLDRSRIYTPHEVEFRYGESRGSGRDLTIALLNEPADPSQPAKAKQSGVQSITLARLDQLHLAGGGQGLLGTELTKGRKDQAAAEAPVELTCQGPFTFDVVAQRARFEDAVEVLRLTPGAPADRLRCDQLLLEFASGNAVPAPDQAASPNLAASPDSPLAGRLQRLVALGRPAVMESPSAAVRASAASLEYAPLNRRITLKPEDEQRPGRKVTQVSLQQQDQHFIARELQFEMADGGRLGKLWAGGPGELKMLQKTGDAVQPIVARWDQSLNVRPDGGNQAISLVGAASVTLESRGRFDADELHLWVLEVPAAQNGNPSMAAVSSNGPSPALASPPSGQATGNNPGRTTIVPHRLLASGNARLSSPQLDLDTPRLEAWFIHRPPSASGPAPATASQTPPTVPRPQAPPLTPQAPPLTSQASSLAPHASPPPGIAEPALPPPLQKFKVTSDLVQMQVVAAGQEMKLEDLTLAGRAVVDEVRTPEIGQEPIHIAGKSIELRRGTSPEATIQVTGQPAEVAGRGLYLTSTRIHLHQGSNRLWIDAPGEATFPIPAGDNTGLGLPALETSPQSPPGVPRAQPSEPQPPQKMHVQWEEQLDFDGLTMRLSGDVRCRTATQLAYSRKLEASLSKRISFASTGVRGQQQPELAQLHLAGDVAVKNWGKDQRGEQNSLDQLHVPDLTIDRTTGRLHASGPGWFNTVRRSDASSGFGQSPLPGAQGPQQPPAVPLAAAPPGDNSPLTSIHIDFVQGIEGDLNQHTITFVGHVHTTYSPTSDFNAVIVAKRHDDLGERGVLMTSDRLRIDVLSEFGTRWIEMNASGNTHVEGRSFTVQAASVRYNSAKEVLTIEGDGRADAHLWWQSAPGQPPDDSTFRKVQYNLRTGQFLGGDFSNINLRNLRGGLQFGPLAP